MTCDLKWTVESSLERSSRRELKGVLDGGDNQRDRPPVGDVVSMDVMWKEGKKGARIRLTHDGGVKNVKWATNSPLSSLSLPPVSSVNDPISYTSPLLPHFCHQSR